MIVTFDIENNGELTPVMVSHMVGNLIGLPFEVVSCGNDDEVVQLSIEIASDDITDGMVEYPFNKEE